MIPAPPKWAPNYAELWNEDGTPKPITVPIADFMQMREEAWELMGRLYDLGKKKDRKRILAFRDKWYGVVG